VDVDPHFAPEGRGLVAVTTLLEADGFVSHLRAVGAGRVACEACGAEFDAGALEVGRFERTEGASDPADMLIVMGGTCPSCGARGTLVLGYGPLVSDDDMEVERRLPPIEPSRH